MVARIPFDRLNIQAPRSNKGVRITQIIELLSQVYKSTAKLNKSNNKSTIKSNKLITLELKSNLAKSNIKCPNQKEKE